MIFRENFLMLELIDVAPFLKLMTYRSIRVRPKL